MNVLSTHSSHCLDQAVIRHPSHLGLEYLEWPDPCFLSPFTSWHFWSQILSLVVLTAPIFPPTSCCAHSHILSPRTMLVPLPWMPLPLHFTSQLLFKVQLSSLPQPVQLEPGAPWLPGRLVLISIAKLEKALCVVALSGWGILRVRTVSSSSLQWPAS